MWHDFLDFIIRKLTNEDNGVALNAKKLYNILLNFIDTTL